jgi:hypothetical protein
MPYVAKDMKQGFPSGEFRCYLFASGGLDSDGLMLMTQDPSEPQGAQRPKRCYPADGRQPLGLPHHDGLP